MALGMAAMALPGGSGLIPQPALRFAFAALAVALVAARPLAFVHGGHKLHHAAMSGIMALMIPAHQSAATPGMPDSTMPTPTPMALTHASTAAAPVLLAAFGYAGVSALAFASRIPALAPPSAHRGRPDPVGHGCEIVMLVSTTVLLLPMI